MPIRGATAGSSRPPPAPPSSPRCGAAPRPVSSGSSSVTTSTYFGSLAGKTPRRSRSPCRRSSRPSAAACRRCRSCRPPRSPARRRSSPCRSVTVLRSMSRAMAEVRGDITRSPRLHPDRRARAWAHPDAAVRDRGIGRGQVQRARRQAVAVGDRQHRDLGPVPLRQERARVRRLDQLHRRRFEEAERAQEVLLRFDAHHARDPRRPDVRGLHDHVSTVISGRSCGSR
jgi:hypothetical protein